MQDGGSIFELEQPSEEFALRACYGTRTELVRQSCRRSGSASRTRSSGMRRSPARCGSRPISTSSRPTPTSRPSATGRLALDGRAAAAQRARDNRSAGRPSPGARRPVPRRRPSNCSRRLPASPHWRSTTRACSASSSARASSWRSRGATSPSSSPACRTSSAPRSTPSSASPSFWTLSRLTSARRRTTARASSHSPSRHLLGLINDVLDSRRSRPGRSSRSSTVRPGPPSRARRHMVRVRARAKGLELLFEVAPGLPRRAFGDEGKLDRC